MNTPQDDNQDDVDDFEVPTMLYILLTLLVAFWAYNFFTKRRLPQGPWGFPILGYLPFLNPKAPHETLTTLAKQYGDIYGLYLGSVYTIILSNAALITAAFSKSEVTGRAPLYITHGIMGGYGLICAEGEIWRVHRKFTAKYLRLFGATKSIGPKTKKLEELVMAEVLDCIEDIEAESKKELAVDPLNHLQHHLGSVMCLLVFGKTWLKNDKTWMWLQHLQETGTKAIGVAGPLNFLPFLRHIPKYKKVMAFLLEGKHKTHKIYQKLIEEQRQKFDITNPDFIPENLIQAFLREMEFTTVDNEFFSNEQFYHLLADIFGAGLDTTLTTLRWYILYLAAYPHVQNEIQKELDSILRNRHPTMEDLESLPLTRASLAETQRIRSVVPVGIPHATMDAVELFGYEIPNGTMILPLQWAVHMDPKVWKNPEEFNPCRFLNDEGGFSKPKEFIPFQTGKRMCVGDELANILLFLFGATIVQRFKILPQNSRTIDLEGEIGITLTPKQQPLIFSLRCEG